MEGGVLLEHMQNLIKYAGWFNPWISLEFDFNEDSVERKKLSILFFFFFRANHIP